MKENDLVQMLKKVDEIKALFIFGQRVVPYLEELVIFVQETTPILQEMNASIAESSKKMPYAVQQLDKVSETTEMATTDMLDLIDHILDDLGGTMGLLEVMAKKDEERGDREKKIILKLANALDGEAETKAANVEEALQNYIDESRKKDDLGVLRNRLTDVQCGVYEIMNKLQVQDITTQQLMAVNSLIESIQQKLTELIAKFSDIDVDELPQKTRVFDPNASYTDKREIQALADLIMEARHFKEQGVREVDLETSKKVIADLFSVKKEKASQDEIDHLINELRK